MLPFFLLLPPIPLAPTVGANTERQARDIAVDQHLGSLEEFVSGVPERAAEEDRRLVLLEQRAASTHRRAEAFDLRVAQLEDYTNSQYTAAVVVDNWGAHFDERVSDLEHRMNELELIRLYEIWDERVSALETVVVDLEAWRPGVDGFIDDTRLKMLRLTKQWDRAMLETPAPPVLLVLPESIAERSPAGQMIDWPKGHGVESTTQERNYGSVTTIVPTQPMARNHFEMYSVHPSVWIRIATHHFTHAAALYSPKSTTIKGALPLPPPPPRPALLPAPIERRAGDDKKPGNQPARLDDKLSMLRSFRKARGLCVRCGDKWVPGHKCAATPQLHALQKVWEMCQEYFSESDSASPQDDTPSPSSEMFLMLSSAAVSGQSAPRTMQFQGSIYGQTVLILIDSGSSHSFLNAALTPHMPGIQQLSAPVTSLQNHKFHSNLRLLPLASYDMIIGMDWLEAFSPMKGLSPESEKCSVLQLYQIAADSSGSSAQTMLPESTAGSRASDIGCGVWCDTVGVDPSPLWSNLVRSTADPVRVAVLVEQQGADETEALPGPCGPDLASGPPSAVLVDVVDMPPSCASRSPLRHAIGVVP
ncbi:unnamed protein product [Miscanthus lutarioriparius]|uniref:Uncharacterized protein n=1 Tax=Miscanthus lutarioriparius TaxID=422564 RepID=A0A811RVS2_9POAL|nr:unnamed protein product [Miscanthus lutarioriparius]